MNAIAYLTKQHRELEKELEALLDAKTDARAPLLAKVGDKLMSHVLIEERELYPAVNQKRTEDILLESLEEHLSIKRVLADLLGLALDDPRFEAKLHVLKEQAQHHHKEEEENLFPKVKKIFDEARLEELGTKLEALQKELLEGDPRKLAPQQIDEAAELG